MQTQNQIALTVSQLREIFQLQYELNVLYTGNDWRHNTKLGWWLTALSDEWVETTRELEYHWKWYNKNATNNHNKAVFEIADMVHFMTGSILKISDIDDINRALSSIEKSKRTIDYFVLLHMDKEDPFLSFQKLYAQFIASTVQGLTMLSIERMVLFIGGLTRFLSIINVDIYNAYKIKNQRNRERVAGGVMQGIYDKSKEQELTL